MKATRLILISTLCMSQVYAFNYPRQATKSYECDVCSQLSHEKLHDKWEISDAALTPPVSNSQKSYSYRQRITQSQLQEGFTVFTRGSGAVIRITPLHDKTIPELKITTPGKQQLSLKEASALYSEDETFGSPHMSTKHQTMVQIKPELGAGSFIIKGENITTANAEAYLVNVYDKFSSTYLEVKTDSLHYQFGDKLTATISLIDSAINYDVDDISATLIGPSGQQVSLKIEKVKRNQFKASALLDSELNDHGENWYIETDVATQYGQESVRRTGHTAFSYSVPSASIISLKKLSSKPLTFVATIDVATASRYALQSVLYRKNNQGETKPIETSQRGQWLDVGKQVIQFTFDNSSQLADDNLYLGYLRLIDYGQLKTVYQYNQPIKLTQLVE